MEKIRIYNENGEDTGKVVTRGEYKPADGEFMLAAVMIVRIGEKVLITKRDKNKTFAGMWEFPGGAVHADEDSKEAGIRELKEETGLLIDVVKPAYTFTKIREDYQTVGIGFLAYSHDDQVTISFEHTDYKWCSIDELKDYLCDEIYQDIIYTLKEYTSI